MKNKKYYIGKKKEAKGLFQSSSILKSIYDAKYDLSQLKILTVDGVIPFLDSDGSRLLFFHSIPSIAINNDEEEKCLNKCLVEIRMSTPTLKMISDILNYELQCFENEQRDNKKCELKDKNDETGQWMFG